MQDFEIRRDFERCFTFYKTFIKQSSGSQINEAMRVAEVSLHRKGNDEVKDRYYSKEQYKKLSTNSRENLWKLREGRPQGGRPQGRRDKENEPHKKIRKLEQKAKKFQRTIKKLEAKRVSNDDNEKSNSSDSDYLSADDAAGPNHNHPTLRRQGTAEGEIKVGGKKQ